MKKFLLVITSLLLGFAVMAQDVAEMNRLILTQSDGQRQVFEIESIEDVTFVYDDEDEDDDDANKSYVSVEVLDVYEAANGYATINTTMSEGCSSYKLAVFTETGLKQFSTEAALIDYMDTTEGIGSYTQNLEGARLQGMDMSEGLRFEIVTLAINEDQSYGQVRAYRVKATNGFQVDMKLVSAHKTDLTVRFTPSDRYTPYIARIVSQAELQEMGCYLDSACTRIDETQTLAYLTSNPYIGTYRQEGDYETTLSNLAPGTKYVAVAFEDFADVMKINTLNVQTLEGSIEEKFVAEMREVSYTSAMLDVTPLSSNIPWACYLMEKEHYVTYKEPIQNCYYGMYNAFSGNQGYAEFSDYLRTIAFYGDGTVVFENLESDKEYVACLYYISLATEDPTDIYDWYYLPVEFTTLEPDPDMAPQVDVTLEKVLADEVNYYLYVNVKLNDVTTSAFDAIQHYSSFGHYYEAGGWDNVGDLFHSPYYGNHSITAYATDALTQAKTAEGFTFVKTWTKDNYDYYLQEAGSGKYGICITAFTDQGARAQNGIIITEDDFENAGSMN